MQRIVFSLGLVATCCLLSACTLPRGAALSSEILREQREENPGFALVPVTRANVETVAAWPATGWSGSYSWVGNDRGPDSPVIRPGDLVDLTIWDSQENSLLASPGQKVIGMQGMQVSPSGALFVPYVGEVVVNGLTPSAARGVVQSALIPMVPAAQVLLTVKAGKQNTVDLVSGVARPGSFPLPDRNFTVLSLIAQGGGIQPDLRNPLVRLIRGTDTYEVRADRLFQDGSLNTVLRGGDKVLVEEDRRYFTALGATGTERLIHFEKDRITGLEALSIIGGIADARANPRGVLVLREYRAADVRTDGTGPEMPEVVFTFDLTRAEGLFSARQFQINPGDTVLVTESPVIAVQTVAGLLGTALGLRSAANP